MDDCLISLCRKNLCISGSDEGQSENRPKCPGGGGEGALDGNLVSGGIA